MEAKYLLRGKILLGKLVNPSVVIVGVAALRLLPHLPNFTPIAGLALFGGAYLNRRYAIILPVVAMFISDIFIGFYSPVVMLSVYGSFVLTGLIGLWLARRKSATNVIFAAASSSVLFFLVTNFAVWFAWYPKNLAGLISCYTLAIPFFRNTLLGDLFYTGVFFGGYELVLRLVKKPAIAPTGK
jgi:hypothetical protein